MTVAELIELVQEGKITIQQFSKAMRLSAKEVSLLLGKRAPWPSTKPEVAEAEESMGSEWKEHGLCVDFDPEMWYAKGSSPDKDSDLGADDESTKRAKAICRVCPVQIQCLTYALVAKEQHGIWGGMDARERRRYARNRGYPANGNGGNESNNGRSEASA